MRKLVLLLLFPLLLSCRPLPLLLVLLDPYYQELLAADGDNAASLRDALSFRVRVETLGPRAEASVEAERLIRAGAPEWVFLSPLLPVDADALAARLPGVRFLREQPGPPRAPNLQRLRFARVEAFRDAGSIAARLLTRPSLQPVLGDRVGHPPKAGLLQAAPTPQGALEAEAFRAAFVVEAGPGLLVERTLGSLSDTSLARRALEQMREEGVAVFVLKTYALSSFCLEFLRTEGGVAVLEQSAGSRAFPAQVVLWFEEDLAGALRNLAATGAGESVTGPVRLVPGAALRSLPEQARTELGFPELFE